MEQFMKKNNVLTIFTVIFFIIIIFSILFLKKTTVFDYQAVTCNIKGEKIETVISKKQADNIIRNHFFYYKGRKYFYKVLENIKNENLIYLELSTNKKLSQNQVDSIYIPIKKVSLLKILLESGRL